MSLKMRLYAAVMKRNRHSAWSSASSVREHMSHPRVSAPIPHEFYQVNHVVTETVAIPAESSSSPDDAGEDTAEFTVHSLVPATDAPRDAPLDICIYVHGGGYLDGINTRHWQFISDLAASGMKVIVPDYGLAPNYEASSARDLLTIIFNRASHEAATSGHRLLLAGDSAGAGLALGWLLAEKPKGRALVDRIALLSPWLDITCSTPGIETLLAADPLLHPNSLRTAGASWARTVGVRHPLVSPLAATDEQVTALPPLAVWTGTRDILHADALALEQRLQSRNSAKTPANHDHFHTCAGAIHNYPLTSTPEGEKARHEVIDWLSGRE